MPVHHCCALALLSHTAANAALHPYRQLSAVPPWHLQVRLLLLAALSQEHVLYIGPPGTAKSEIGRRLSRLIKGNYFERLLTRFSVPEVRGGRLCLHLPAYGIEWSLLHDLQ
jgi:hypothetical protein